MRASPSPDAFADTMSARMQEEAYKAAKDAATKAVNELSMEELLRAKKKKKGTNEAPTNVGTGPRQPGLVPKKARVADCTRGRRDGAI